MKITVTFDSYAEFEKFMGNSTTPPTKRNTEEDMKKATVGRKKKDNATLYGAKPTVKTATKRKTKHATRPTSRKAGRQPRGFLSAIVAEAIENNLSKKTAFTANDIYNAVVKKGPNIEKQSVATTVLKQMTSTYKGRVRRTSRKGTSPRPVNVYTPVK